MAILRKPGVSLDVSAGAVRITPATWITLGRGALGASLVGFAVISTPDGIAAWLPATIFALAGLLDAVDGAVARRTGTVSALGERLDTEADGLLVFVGAVLVVADGLAPRWFLAVGLARYAFVAGVWLRRQRGLAVGTDDARLATVLPYAATMIGIWTALLPVTTADHTVPLLSVVGVVLLGSFLRSWLVIT